MQWMNRDTKWWKEAILSSIDIKSLGAWGWQDVSLDKSICHQAQWSEFNPLNSHKDRRKELIPEGCSLTSVLALWHIQTRT